MQIHPLIDPFALRQDGSKPLTANWDAGPYKLTARQLESNVATGTAPLIVASTTLVSNLNADLWDGYQFADYLDQAVKTTSSPTFVTGTFTDIIVDTNLIKTVSATNRIGFNVAAPTCTFDLLGCVLFTGSVGDGEDSPTAFEVIGGTGAALWKGGPSYIRGGVGGIGLVDADAGAGGLVGLYGGDGGAIGDGDSSGAGGNIVLAPGSAGAGGGGINGVIRLEGDTSLITSDFLVPSGSRILLTEAALSDIAIGSYGNRSMYFESQGAGNDFYTTFFTKDGDGSDGIDFRFYSLGTLTDTTDYELFLVGTVGSATPANRYYHMASFAGGSGDVRPIKIYTSANTSQFTLLATGNNTMAGSLMVGAATEAVTKLTIEGALTLKEQAAADGDTAAYGQLWAKTVTPNQLWFTNDAGNDSELSLVAYGEIYTVAAADTIAIATAGKVNKVQITSFDTDGASINSTPDHTNDHITITKAGYYLCIVSLHIESAGGGGADTFGFSVYKNDGNTEFANCHAHRRLAGGGGDVGSVSISGIIDLAVSDTIELWCWNEDSTDDLVIQDVTLSLIWIGST